MNVSRCGSTSGSVGTYHRSSGSLLYSPGSSDRDTGNAPRKSVLLLDDDPSVRRDLGELFRLSGFDVKSFSTAREFLAYRRSDAPACLVLDVVLPDANGIDLQRHLAKTDPELPIVLITGHMDDALRERALGSGAFAFLAKPLEWPALRDEIRQAFAWTS
ncbi:MAG TPA: response regulator [Thermoanaerobaculia bacterium]|jgi:FixJ family two-component response regulator|nr:response regulator [Thermoanaerobaculia bacterium]